MQTPSFGSVTRSLVAMFAIVVAVLSLAAGVTSQTCGSYDVTPVTNYGDVFKGVAQGSDMELTSSLANSSTECQERCCSQSAGPCNVVVFAELAEAGAHNCFLHFCQPLAYCGFTPQAGISVFTVMTPQQPAPQPTQAATQAATPPPPQASTQSPNPNPAPTQAPVQSPPPVQSPGQSANPPAAQQGEATPVPPKAEVTSQAPAPPGAGSNPDAAQPSSAAQPNVQPSSPSNPSTTTSTTQSATSQPGTTKAPDVTTANRGGQDGAAVSTTASVVENSTKADNSSQQNLAGEGSDDASSSTSSWTMVPILAAAFSFGVVFLLAVTVLVGKRVFEAWQRRHYSRVDYLVNGMYP